MSNVVYLEEYRKLLEKPLVDEGDERDEPVNTAWDELQKMAGVAHTWRDTESLQSLKEIITYLDKYVEIVK